MAETIKGINVVIGSDTTGLAAALSDVTKKSKDIQSELKQVEKLLRLDPTNTELLAQKQQLLQSAVANTSEKLERLRVAQQQVNDQFARGDITEGQYRAFQREVVATEQELGRLQNNLEDVTQTINEQGRATSQLAQDYRESLQEAQQQLGNTFDKAKVLGTAITAAGAAMAAGLGAAVKTASDFETQMDRVGAISNATADEMKALSKTALELGASTSKSASEVAEGMENMAALGYTAKDIIGAMPGVISAAEASGSDMAQTAEVMATALNIFGLSADKATAVADVLAKTANVSAANITDMQYALKYAGPPAAALGVSLEELSAAIGIMTNAGMQGEQAGTSLRGALLGLLSPSEANSKLMAKMGTDVQDASGNFVGLAQLIENLSNSMDGWTETEKAATLATLVGKEAVSGMLSLMKAGPDEIRKMTGELENSAGASAEAAAIMRDNLAGAMDNLSGSIETASITIGTALIPAIKKAADIIGSLVDRFNSLSDGAKRAIAVSAAIASALALIVGPILMIIGFIPQIVAGLGMIGITAEGIGAAFAVMTGPIGIAVAAAIAAVVLIIKYWDPIKEFFINLWSAISDATVKIWDGMTSWLSGAWDAIKTGAVTAFTAIRDFLVGVWDTIVSALKGAWEAISSGATGAFSALFDLLKPIIEGYKTYFLGVWEAIKNIFLGAILLIVDLVTFNFSDLAKDAQAIWNNLKDAFAKIWDGIKGVFGGALKLIADGLSAAWSGITSAASTAWTGFKDVVSRLVSATLEGIKAAWISTVDWFRGLPGTLANIGVTMFETMRSAIATTIVTVKSAIVDGFTTALDFLRGLPKELFNMGKDIIQGLIDGIKSMVGSIGDAIKGIAGKITGGIRDALDIHSPSRVMRQIGLFTGQGMALGIADSVSAVRQQANALAAAAQPGVTAAAGSGTAGGSNNTYNLAGMMAGANFYVRSDDDIKELARQLFEMASNAGRATGGARA